MKLYEAYKRVRYKVEHFLIGVLTSLIVKDAK